MKRLSAIGSAFAYAQVALSRVGELRVEGHTETSIEHHIAFTRCHCPTCREADKRERWGAWQYRLL